MAAASASSLAVNATMIPRASAIARCSALPYLPPHPPPRRSSARSFVSPVEHVTARGFQRLVTLKTQASSSEETSPAIDTNELFTDLKEKWDGLENKSTVLLYGGGAIVAVWLSSVVVGAINSVPLLPKIMELVGLGYTGWFVYRYLLFKSSRKELAEDIESIKKKISGTE